MSVRRSVLSMPGRRRMPLRRSAGLARDETAEATYVSANRRARAGATGRGAGKASSGRAVRVRPGPGVRATARPAGAGVAQAARPGRSGVSRFAHTLARLLCSLARDETGQPGRQRTVLRVRAFFGPFLGFPIESHRDNLRLYGLFHPDTVLRGLRNSRLPLYQCRPCWSRSVNT